MDTRAETRGTETLELEQDRAFQRRDWVFQRLGWIVLGLVVIGALLGLFGAGPLSEGVAGRKDGELWVDYQRFWRRQSPLSLRINVGAEPVTGRHVTVRISRTYLEAVTLQYVMPQPRRVEVEPEFVSYVFDAGTARPVAVTFTLEVIGPGLLTGKVGLEGGPEVEFAQLIYP